VDLKLARVYARAYAPEDSDLLIPVEVTTYNHRVVTDPNPETVAGTEIGSTGMSGGKLAESVQW
jgi:hypothetical protein